MNHTTDVYDGEIPGSVQARCTCGWEGRIRRNIVEAGMEAQAHEDGHQAR